MKRENLKARLLRAVSGKSQEQLGEEIGDPTGIIGQIEQGKLLARPAYLERLAANEGLTTADAEDLLRRYETLRTSRRRRGQSAQDLLEGVAEDLRSNTRRAMSGWWPCRLQRAPRGLRTACGPPSSLSVLLA